ncbi:polyhydroxyalkanoic acid system family protein [Tautonia sp. JC769]|uniref:polyhydroxyalkanoic acid system family protein n=1 Tax=Tautonia sp. JC769 TaxID=3232135 RepID=UPI0034578059
MPLIEFRIKHNRTPEDAKARLSMAVDEVRRQYGVMIQRIEWSPGHDEVTITATGAVAEMSVDAEHIHATIDIPVLGGLLGGRLATGLKRIVQRQLSG